MLGRTTSGRASRAPCTASSTDSVPPEVTVPTTVPGASSSRAAKPTSSFSIRSRLGNAVGSSPLVAAKAPTAALASRVDVRQAGGVDVGEGAAGVQGQVVGAQGVEPGQDVVHQVSLVSEGASTASSSSV